MNDSFPRRSFLAGGSLWGAGVWLGLPSSVVSDENQTDSSEKTQDTPMAAETPMISISSHNGLAATKKAYELMSAGTDTLDAAIAGVGIVEDDPNDTSVGYGGLPNEDGVVELDAAVMHGPTHRAGAVAAIRRIRHPAQVAKLVLERSDHVLLVGEGALRFAKAHGFQEESLLTEKARKIWLYWKQTLSPRDDWLPPSPDQVDPDVAKFFKISSNKPQTPEEKALAQQQDTEKFERPTGTIHCAALNGRGEISCTTTTSGLAFKIPGRVGDSPIIGAGLYCDNNVGSCGSTGRGEANLQNLCSFAVVELMRQGAAPKEAGLEVMKRVAENTEPRLRNKAGEPDFGLKFYALAKDGRYAGISMWGPADFAVTDKNGTRHEACASLYQKDKK